jgi:hypothetical protein
MDTGEREWECELSTIDTAIFIAGVLSVAGCFSKTSKQEKSLFHLSLIYPGPK